MVTHQKHELVVVALMHELTTVVLKGQRDLDTMSGGTCSFPWEESVMF